MSLTLKVNYVKICLGLLTAILALSLLAANGCNHFVYGETTNASLFVSPPVYIAQEIGEVFNVTIRISNVKNLHSLGFALTYNTSLLEVEQVFEGSFFPAPPRSYFEFENNTSVGFIKVNMSLAPSEAPRNGDGTLALISFKVVQGMELRISNPLDLKQISLLDSASAPIVCDSVGAVYFWRWIQPDPPVDGRSLDVYTQKGGVGPDAPDGEFGVYEIVYLSSLVTYNNDSVQHKVVAFEVRNPINETVLIRTAITGKDGLAEINFMIPNTLSSNGTWKAISLVDIECKAVWDTISFLVHVPKPVGGYTFPIKEYLGEKLLAFYLAITGILAGVFTLTRRKTRKILGRRTRNIAFVLILLLLLPGFNVLLGTSNGADITITDFYSCDKVGKPQYSFPKKTIAYFNVSVKNLASNPENIYLSLTAQDVLSVPIGSDERYATIASGSSAYYIMSVLIPKWVYVGTATAYVSVFVGGIPVDSRSTSFYIGPEDLTPPVIQLLFPKNVTYQTESVPLVFMVNERTSWMGYSLNNQKNVTIAGNTTLTGLPNGSYSVRVYANDTSGNMGSSNKVNFTVLIVHDVAVINLNCSPSKVHAGQIVNMTAIVKNEGTVTESFNVTIYANADAIQTLTVANLPPSNQATLAFTWNTAGFPMGNYTMWAYAWPVSGETDTADNTYIDGIVRIPKPPVARFTFSPTVPFTGETITFNASLSTPDGGIIISYEWSFGDGTPNATDMIATHAYADDGMYTVTLVVTDSDGLTSANSQGITVFNRPPIASFTESATTVPTGTIVKFNASSSYDSDGYIVDYFWNFGDGSNGTGVTTEHAYADNGTYTVTLTVTDDDGSTAVATVNETVLNRSPVALFVRSAETVVTGTVVLFNASDSFDPDGSIVAYAWDFGDGTPNAIGIIVTHAYTDDGKYTVTLTVMDNDGATNTTIAVETVLNRPPIADFTESATTVYTGEFIDFNASTSYDPDGMIVNYFWNFGDGTNATGVVTNHAYSDDGVYIVTLTVIDDDGAVATLTESKTVLNRPPVAAFTESAETVYTSEGITFDASSSFDLDGVIVTYFWDFGDGINATGVVVNHAYTRNGTYTVTLTVTDDDGMSASTSAIKTVQNRPDVAVTHVTVSRTVIGRGYSMNVSVTVANQGEYTETFNVTLYANTTFVTSATITLLAGNSMTIIFTWNTAGFAYGKYKVSAVADTLPGEADVSDNTLADGLVAVTILGDVNGDLKVDGKDVAYAAKAYNTRPGQLNWNPNADVNCDGKVDGKDLTAIAKYFGTHYP